MENEDAFDILFESAIGSYDENNEILIEAEFADVLNEEYRLGDLTLRAIQKVKLAIAHRKAHPDKNIQNKTGAALGYRGADPTSTPVKSLVHAFKTPNAKVQAELRARGVDEKDIPKNEKFDEDDMIAHRKNLVVGSHGQWATNAFTKDTDDSKMKTYYKEHPDEGSEATRNYFMNFEPADYRSFRTFDINGKPKSVVNMIHGNFYPKDKFGAEHRLDSKLRDGRTVHDTLSDYGKGDIQSEVGFSKKKDVSELNKLPNEYLSCMYTGKDSVIKNPNGKSIKYRPPTDPSNFFVDRGGNKQYIMPISTDNKFGKDIDFKKFYNNIITPLVNSGDFNKANKFFNKLDKRIYGKDYTEQKLNDKEIEGAVKKRYGLWKKFVDADNQSRENPYYIDRTLKYNRDARKVDKDEQARKRMKEEMDKERDRKIQERLARIKAKRMNNDNANKPRDTNNSN